MRRSLSIFLALLLATTVVHAQEVPGVANLERVGTELALFQRPGAILSYVRTFHPELYERARRAGFADALDGRITAAELAKKLAAEGGLDAQAATLVKIVATLARKGTSGRQGTSAAEAESLGETALAGQLRPRIFDASQNWLTKLWSPKSAGTVGVRSVPGKVTWYDPTLSIPELGIQRGVPWTEEQKRAIVSLYSFETLPDGSKGDGTAAFPLRMGRTLNPNGVLTILNDKGEVLSDLSIKGAGVNREENRNQNGAWAGVVRLPVAQLEAEVHRNFSRLGVNNSSVVCIIETEGRPGFGIVVRAPRSLLRDADMGRTQDDLEEFSFADVSQAPLSNEELAATLDHVAKEAAYREGHEDYSAEKWVLSDLPRDAGMTAGMLEGLGVHQGRGMTLDNTGLVGGETIDWATITISDEPTHLVDGVPRYGWEVGFKNFFDRTIGKIAQVFPHLLETASTWKAEVEAIFDRNAAVGRKRVAGERMIFDPKEAEGFLDVSLSDLAEPLPWDGTERHSDLPREKALAILKAKGRLGETPPPVEQLLQQPVEKTREFARQNGITLPVGQVDRVTLAASVSGKTVTEVTKDAAAIRGARSVGLTQGMSPRDRAQERAEAESRPRADAR
jgi:hypothetical protein